MKRLCNKQAHNHYEYNRISKIFHLRIDSYGNNNQNSNESKIIFKMAICLTILI